MNIWSPFREGYEADLAQAPSGDEETWLTGLQSEPPPIGAEGFDFGEAEAEFEDAHPISAEFPSLPAGVLEALSHGLTSVAVGLAAAAGYRDLDQLTDVIFFFRHPDLVGRRIRPDEKTLAQEWVAIRDRIVKPALQSGSAPHAAPISAAAPPAELSSAQLQWPGASSEKLAFMRAVYEAHAAHSRASGRRFVADLSKDALAPVDGHEARKDAAAAATKLLADANAALAAAGLAATTRIGIVSAYRPATLQFQIWQGRNFDGIDRGGGFPYYYEQALKEGVIHPGDYGPDAVQAFAHYLGGYIASPGYSNHQDGLAFDFGTGLVGKHLGAIGWKAWFRHWLEQNAAQYHFVPLATEAWHWTYTPPTQPEPEFEFEFEFESEHDDVQTSTGIRAGRLEVAHVPLLAHHRGSGPDLVLRWNDMSSAVPELDVVIHLHGFWYPHLSLTRDIEPVSGLDLAPIDGESGNGRTRPTLTVLPRGNDTGVKQPHGPYNAYTFPALVTRAGLPGLIDHAVGQFAASNGVRSPRVARLVLTAHSGGGLALIEILQHHDPHQVHVFDALYWSPASLITWARNRIARDRAAGASREYMETQGGALRIFYQGRFRGGTRPNSMAVENALSHELGDGLNAWYRVEASDYDHFQIPRRYGWRVLADASSDVPKARTESAGAHEADFGSQLDGESYWRSIAGADEASERLENGVVEFDTPRSAGTSAPAPSVVEPFAPPSKDVTFGSTIAGISSITGDPEIQGLCAALADLTDDPSNPPYVGVNDDDVIYPGSLQKISAMYAAFLLRKQVQSQVDAAVHAGLSTSTPGWEDVVVNDLEKSWAPKLHSAFPKLPEMLPKLATIFEFTNAAKVRFPRTVSDARLASHVRVHGTPEGHFGDWLVSMIRWSNNEAAGKCIRALGFPYINGALKASGFFTGSPEHGLWLSGSYAHFDWLPHPPGEPNVNPAGQPLTKRWATKEGRVKSNMTATAAQLCRFMTLLARGDLVDATASGEMKELMDKSKDGTVTFIGSALGTARSPDRLWSKIGIGDSIGDLPGSYHDCGIVERTITTRTGPKTITYVVVGLGSLREDTSDLERLFRTLDDLIVARHP